MKLKVIDYELINHNTVNLFLGDIDDNDYWGDDWNDVPFEHNAGEVYDQFIKGEALVNFYGYEITDMSDGVTNSIYSKEDFKNNLVPALLINKDGKLIDTISFNGIVRVKDQLVDVKTDHEKLSFLSFIVINEEED